MNEANNRRVTDDGQSIHGADAGRPRPSIFIFHPLISHDGTVFAIPPPPPPKLRVGFSGSPSGICGERCNLLYTDSKTDTKFGLIYFSYVPTFCEASTKE